MIRHVSQLARLRLIQGNLSGEHLSPFAYSFELLLRLFNLAFALIKSPLLKQASPTILRVVHKTSLQIKFGIREQSLASLEFTFPVLGSITFKPAHHLLDARVYISKRRSGVFTKRNERDSHVEECLKISNVSRIGHGVEQLSLVI